MPGGDRQPRRERGTALLELALLAPALLVLALSALDVGLIARSYFVLAQTVREAVRQGGSSPYLEPGTYELEATSLGTWLCNGGDNCPAQQDVLLRRIKDVLAIQAQSLDIDLDTSKIISTYSTTAHTLQIRIQTKYRGLFPPFAGLPLASTATGPYT